MSWFGDDAPLTHDAGVSGKWTDQIVLVSGKCLDGMVARLRGMPFVWGRKPWGRLFGRTSALVVPGASAAPDGGCTGTRYRCLCKAPLQTFGETGEL
jgi:hypothetical protein